MKFFRIVACIVVVCGALLFVFLCLSVGMAPGNPTQLATQTVMKDLRIAIGNFVLDYRRFPGQPHQSQLVDQRVLSIGPFIDCLIRQNKEWNPREVMYMDLPMARDGKGGYIPADGNNPSRLVDRWGSPYVILLDTSGDKAVENPDVKNSDPHISGHLGEPPSPTLQTDVAVFSCGKDGVEGTSDDIVSWYSRSAPVAGSGGWRWWTKVGIVGAFGGVVLAWFYSRRSQGRGVSSAAVS